MERIVVTAWAESAAGPGWANSPVYVVLRATDGTGTLTTECIQPPEQTLEMHTLYAVSAAVSGAMAVEARKVLAKRLGGRR